MFLPRKGLGKALRSSLGRIAPARWAKAGRRTAVGVAIGAGVIVLPIVGIYLLPVVLGVFAPPLNPSVNLYAINRPPAYTFLDAQGDEIGHRGAIVGERLKLNDMPAYLPAAFIAMEDRHFYSHNGIDPRGLLRALFLDIRAGHIVAGGSTISQQTAKIIYTNQERTFSRKLTELIEAAGLEKSLTKNQILDLYLNRIYLGSGAYGVDGAAHVYFGKSARDLTLAQAAMLATLTRAPSVFSPRRDLLRAQQRATFVLDAMVQTGAITETQAAQARAHPAVVIDRSRENARNWFLDTAADRARDLVAKAGGPTNADMVIHTTMVLKVQDAASLAVHDVIAKRGKRARAHEAAAVVMKPDGAVVAMIGGTDYERSVFNRATLAHRQPGSAFKPFVYLAALQEGISPWDTREDVPVDINGYTPTNFGNEHFDTLTLSDALAHSVNTITVNLAQEVGLNAVIRAARRCGITSPLQPNPSLALGTDEVTPLELTGAYAAFANGGFKTTPYLVTAVDVGGKQVYRRVPALAERMINPATDRDMVAMLYNVVETGTGHSASLYGREAAGKTGTTQDFHDAWFVGFTTDYVAGVWVGNDDSAPMRGVTGSSLPARIWRQTMLTAERGKPEKPLDRSLPPLPMQQLISTSWNRPAPAFVPPASALPQLPPPLRTQGPVAGLLDWLFGGDRDNSSR